MSTLKATEKVLNTLSNMVKAHRGEISSAYITWEKFHVVNPRYEDGGYDELVPYVVIDFI